MTWQRRLAAAGEMLVESVRDGKELVADAVSHGGPGEDHSN